MNKWNLLWIIPLSMFVGILLWEVIVVNPAEKLHWDLTFSCLEDLYNVTVRFSP